MCEFQLMLLELCTVLSRCKAYERPFKVAEKLIMGSNKSTMLAQNKVAEMWFPYQ